jgi:hypothetical protein
MRNDNLKPVFSPVFKRAMQDNRSRNDYFQEVNCPEINFYCNEIVDLLKVNSFSRAKHYFNLYVLLKKNNSQYSFSDTDSKIKDALLEKKVKWKL